MVSGKSGVDMFARTTSHTVELPLSYFSFRIILRGEYDWQRQLSTLIWDDQTLIYFSTRLPLLALLHLWLLKKRRSRHHRRRSGEGKLLYHPKPCISGVPVLLLRLIMTGRHYVAQSLRVSITLMLNTNTGIKIAKISPYKRSDSESLAHGLTDPSSSTKAVPSTKVVSGRPQAVELQAWVVPGALIRAAVIVFLLFLGSLFLLKGFFVRLGSGARIISALGCPLGGSCSTTVR